MGCWSKASILQVLAYICCQPRFLATSSRCRPAQIVVIAIVLNEDRLD
jgi:hypothetical protein